MLAYFGEENGCDCGKCDVCRGRRKSAAHVSKEEMVRQVWQLMQMHPAGLTQTIIEKRFTPLDRLAADALRFLVDEGFAVENHSIYRLREYC